VRCAIATNKAKTIGMHAGIKIRRTPEEGEIDHIKRPISGRAMKSAGTSAIFGAQYRHEYVE